MLEMEHSQLFHWAFIECLTSYSDSSRETGLSVVSECFWHCLSNLTFLGKPPKKDASFLISVSGGVTLVKTGGVCRPLHLWQGNGRPGCVGCPSGLLPAGLLCRERSCSSALGPRPAGSLLRAACAGLCGDPGRTRGPRAARPTPSAPPRSARRAVWFSPHCLGGSVLRVLSAPPCGLTRTLCGGMYLAALCSVLSPERRRPPWPEPPFADFFFPHLPHRHPQIAGFCVN